MVTCNLKIICYVDDIAVIADPEESINLQRPLEIEGSVVEEVMSLMYLREEK